MTGIQFREIFGSVPISLVAGLALRGVSARSASQPTKSGHFQEFYSVDVSTHLVMMAYQMFVPICASNGDTFYWPDYS